MVNKIKNIFMEEFMKKKILTLIITTLLIGVSYAIGATVGDVVLPDSYTVDGQNLMLNGTAIRKKIFIKVYAGGFYAPKKISTPQEVYDDAMPKVIRMHFIYKSVSGNKIQETYVTTYKKEGYDYNSDDAQQFLNIFSFEIKKNDIIDLIFHGNDKLEVKYNDKILKTIEAKSIGLPILKAYFGSYALPELRNGFLGLK